MTIQEIQLSKIKPFKKNVKKHDDRQIEAVAESIRTFGAKQPIVVDKNYVIIIGHCRYEAAKLLGMETFPTIVADLTQNQADALRIADNKTNESEWDYDTLYDELRDLESAIDLSLYGFTVADFIAAHSDDYEPETLDFDGIEDYEENGNSMLKSKQVTISYNTQEERAWLINMLGVEKLKVTMYASERAIIHIIGTNGSGKSTLAKSIINHYGAQERRIKCGGKGLPIVSTDDGMIAVLGTYANGNCGGCDRLSSGDEVLNLLATTTKAGFTTIVFEGVLYQSMTFAKKVRLLAKASDYEYKVVLMNRNCDNCLNSISSRNGGKTIQIQPIVGKHLSTKRLARTLQAAGIDVKEVDTDEYKPEDLYTVI